jgi:integrase
MPEGITVRHQRSCASRGGGRCHCKATYQAQVFDRVSGKRLTRTFDSLAAAKTWRQDAQVGLRSGTMVVGRSQTIRQAGTDWLEGARAGYILNRSGDPYKPSTIRGYEQALREYIYPALGPVRLVDLRRPDLQRLVGQLHRQDLDPSTVRNALMPLRALYRRALSLGEVAANPTHGLELPAVRGRRDRIVSPEKAAALLEQLDTDRALWATALYAGLRHGELRALRWESVNLAEGVISVEATWDHVEGPVAPKSSAGRRRVPTPAVLRDVLVEHRMSTRDRGLVFGRTEELAFSSQTVNDRADRAWGSAELRLHEARHTYASFMIAAGVNAKALSTFMGHSSIQITLDRYGHLMSGAEDEAAELLDAYLVRANTEARKAAIA